MKLEMEDRNESMLNAELNRTASATKLEAWESVI